MSEKATLQRILATSTKILATSSGASGQASALFAPTPSISPSIPCLRLGPAIARLNAELNHSGLPSLICNAASSRIAELSNIYEKNYERLCHRLIASPRSADEPLVVDVIQTIRQTFETRYETQDLPRLLESALKFRTSCRPLDASASSTSERKPFNHQYTPILEQYFVQNAYPSASDRMFLAHQSMMTPRQIEVWFQNHRNRAKKEGKTLKRINNNTPGETVTFDTQISRCTTPDSGRSDTPCEDSSDEDDDSAKFTAYANTIHNNRPDHAFPTPYPPKSDPFQTQSGAYRFAVPQWRRSPSTTRAIESMPVNMDEFITIFALKLSLRDDLARYRRLHSEHHVAWTNPMVIKSNPAPHPAFVPCGLRSKNSKSSRLPVTSPPSCRTSTRARKLPQLSWQKPSSAYSPYSTNPRTRSPQRNLSRTPSLTSSHSSQSRTASLSSLSSEEPLTPPHLPTSLPEMRLTRKEDSYLSLPTISLDVYNWFDRSSKDILPHNLVSFASFSVPHCVQAQS